MKIKLVTLILLTVFLSSCRMADLRTKEIKEGVQNKQKEAFAKELLQKAVSAQGFDNIDGYKTYEITGTDHWKGMLGKMGNTWKWNKDLMVMRYSIGDFDGQVEALEGKKKGFIAGVQSFNYYEKVDGAFTKDVKVNKKISFALTAYHYFFEIAARLSKAPFVRYIGEDSLLGTPAQKVFVSWGDKRTKAYDQYVVWINKKTHLIEAVSNTARENYMPGAGFLYGSMRYTDYKEVGGVKIPFTQTAQLKDPKKLKKHLHQFKITKFEWDSFSIDEIRPFTEIEAIGDSKNY